MRDLLRDLRLACRDLARRPAFTAVVVATLALGIGANALVFSLVDRVLLRPLPYPGADRVVMVWNSWREQPSSTLAMPEVRAYREMRSLAALAAWTTGAFDLAAGGDAERVAGVYAEATLFSVLGVEPILGRSFTSADDRPGAAPVALLGQDLWTRRFAADPAIVGRPIRLDGVETTVVGILPAAARLPSEHRTAARAEIWAPLHPAVPSELAEHWGMHFLQGAARLAPGATLAQAQAEMDVLVGRLATSGPPKENALGQEGFRVVLRPALEEVVGAVRRPFAVLLAAVAVVLAIACANVANLELARARSRHREAALRSALGASRGRLARELLVESAILAGAGGAAGLALAWLGLRLIIAAAPAAIPRLAEVELDWQIVLFVVAVSFATALAFGVLPALRASRVDPASGLRSASGEVADRAEARLRRPLIVAEVALAVILAIGAGLLARTLLNLGRVDPGYRVDSILAVDLAPPETAYADAPQLDDFFARVRAGIESLPGVERAGAASHLPLASTRGDWNFYPEDRAIDANGPKPRGDWQVVTPGWLDAMGIAMVEGRDLEERDDPGSPLVLLVNQSLARRYWPDRSPVGRRIRLGGNDRNPFATVVGVVADVRSGALDREPVPELYVPLAQAAAIMGRPQPRELTVTVRTTGDPALAAGAIRGVVARIDPDLPVANVRTMAQVRSRALAAARFATVSLGGFALLALVLGAVGVFGVMSYLTAGRRREIAIRMALGAERGGILRLVVGQGLRPVLLGIVIGVAVALASSRALGALLYDVEPVDPATYLGVAALFVVVAGLACFAPARRASRVDPAAVLHE